MNFLNHALDFLFPPTCGICGKIGNNLCGKCQLQIQDSNLFLNQIQDYGSDNTKYFEQHYFLFSYKGLIREKIIQYKFNDKPYLADMFFEFFVKNEKVCGFFKNYDIIGPVPISSKRRKTRGYNQSELIARRIGNTGLIQYENILKKVKENQIQSSLNKIQRIENVKNVYKVQNELKIRKKKIVLFDDIYTTGATVNECAKMLKQSGASEVAVVTVAKD